ncbi:hypothetical protein [Kitasatospora sp. NPDC093806]|uniref:hypothetical protein n=1 Tax=Kitasatospora sp. NPDC093806 TaxID=3155075 RepID=UPI003416F260
MRTRTTVRTVLAATAVAAALVVSGCSSQDEAPRVAGAGSGGSSAPQDDDAVRRAWVDCMHQQGQTGVQQDKDGSITVPAAGTGSGSADDYEPAAKICDAKVPGIHQTKQKNNERFVEMARVFVACARKNGYPDLPDPDARTGILNIPGASFDRDKWDAMQPACGNLPMPGYHIGQ